MFDAVEKIRQFFIGSDTAGSKKQTTFKKWLNLGLVVGFVIVCFIILLLFIARANKDNTALNDANAVGNNDENSGLVNNYEKIELGSDATKGEVKWQNFLEESIEAERKTRQEQIDLLKNALTKNQTLTQAEVNNEFNELKSRLSYALREIERMKEDNQNMQSEISMLTTEDPANTAAAELGITAITTKVVTRPPVSSFNYIPATSFPPGPYGARGASC